MKIQKNNVVALSYQLEVEGAIADSADASRPLTYIHGTGMLLPRFEEEVAGKEPGENFAFTLSPEEGYGTYNPQHLIDIPKSAFAVDGKVREDLLVIGQIIPMLNSAGQVLQGKVHAIKDQTVTMDFNHPMAGKTLNFSGRVESVREATEKELREGLHGEYLPQEEEGHCCHGKGHCKHHEDGEGECCHGEGECHHGDCDKDCDCGCQEGEGCDCDKK